MTAKENGTVNLVRASYEIAWQEYCLLPGLTPDENMFGPDKLRSYIQVLAEVGDRDPSKIAKSALGMMRECEQIVRSKARVVLRGRKSD
jgi:hypothetical protein